MRLLLLAGLAGGLAACSLTPPSQAQRAGAAHESKSGGQPGAPSAPGILIHGAPGDDVATPLHCRPDGPDVTCTRDR